MGSVFPQLSHPLRYVAAGVQDAPDVDVVGSLHVENQERVAREGSGAQAGDVGRRKTRCSHQPRWF